METTRRSLSHRSKKSHRSKESHRSSSPKHSVRQKKEIKGGNVRCFLIDGRKIVVQKKKGSLDIVGGKAPASQTAEEYLMNLFAEEYKMITTKPFYVGSINAEGGDTGLFLAFTKSKDTTPDEMFLDELVKVLE